MPEAPDLDVYVDALRRDVVGRVLLRVRLASPFVLRTAVPPVADAAGRRVEAATRLGKRLVLSLDGGLHVAIHLMVLGRLAWKPPAAKLAGRAALAAFDLEHGTLVLTESGSRHRASIHVVDDAGLAALAPGGVDPQEVSVAAFAASLRSENHTLKRALTAPHLVSGVGNAYSDEILHRARLSPVVLTSRLTDEELARLHGAAREVLAAWTARLREEAKGGWPAKVTAFRDEMAVHGKYGKPCPECGTAVQRIVKGENESNYCPRCQTGGKVLADRALSRLLHDDWPRTIEEWEAKRMPR